MFTNRCSLERGFTNGSLTVVILIQKTSLYGESCLEQNHPNIPSAPKKKAVNRDNRFFGASCLRATCPDKQSPPLVKPFGVYTL